MCAHSRKIVNVFFCCFIVTGIHNCLTLSKKFTFYIVYNLLRCYKKLETFLLLEISERSVTRGLDGKIRSLEHANNIEGFRIPDC